MDSGALRSGITPLNRTSSDDAYESIKRLIQSNEFPPGSSIREQVVAQKLGISRTPIREALRQLAAEGWVQIFPNRGAVVVALTDQDIEEIFQLRTLIEPELAALAAVRATPEEIDELEATLTSLDQAVNESNIAQLVALNEEFHTQIFEMGRSKTLWVALNVTSRRVLSSRTFSKYSREEIHRSHSHHTELVSAIRRHDADWARSIMRTHLAAARAIVGDPSGPTN